MMTYCGSAGQAAEKENESGQLESARQFELSVQPLLTKYCVSCHNADEMKSGIRLDQLTASPSDRDLFLLNDVQKQLNSGAMPPKGEPQPSAEEREAISKWVSETIRVARSVDKGRNGFMRRLTVSQYRNTMRDLLGLQENLSDVLPPDGVSRDGFANNGQVLGLSPLQMEYYFDIAEKSLELCMVDEQSKPVIQNFRMDLGENINTAPSPDSLILGADSLLLRNTDFLVTELQPKKSFEYTPFAMRRVWDFIEGYAGNDTVRGMKHFDHVNHSVFACMRGTRGYPKGEPWEMVPDGMLLRPAIPSSELFGQSSTYGPMANFKISLRELPDHGNFRVKVRASRYRDVMLIPAESAVVGADRQEGQGDQKTESNTPDLQHVVVDLSQAAVRDVAIPEDGVYQFDAAYELTEPRETVRVVLGSYLVTTHLTGGEAKSDASGSGEKGYKDEAAATLPDKPQQDPSEQTTQKPIEHSAGLFVCRLSAGYFPLSLQVGEKVKLRSATLTRLDEKSDAYRKFLLFEKRSPLVGVHLGLRRDCGSTLNPVQSPQSVTSETPQEFVFEGAIDDFPSPSVEKDNVNYLAGIREIGVRCEYTDGRDLPRLKIHSVEFEGPLYESWPPETHRKIFIDSKKRTEPETYAAEILRTFMVRAWRRPVTDDEVNRIHQVWRTSWSEDPDFQRSIRDAMLVVLTAPQFLFLIEKSETPASEDLNDWELACKLSYFLWNAPPDERLLTLAQKGQLRSALRSETERLIEDQRFRESLNEFVPQWLSLDKFDVVETDSAKYPKLTRDVRSELRKEPVAFIEYLIRHNRPLRNILDSELLVANDAVASYYGLGDRSESGLSFVAIEHNRSDLGGVLSQAAVLAGLSDGRESNPIKRGAWFARKMISEPPDDPPPNVPQLSEENTEKLTLRQRLEQHRNQEGCFKCHSNIDPWGIPFEHYDAGGLRKQGDVPDAQSLLPDGNEVKDLADLKKYLANQRMNQIAFSFARHVSCYATGRSLTYNETEWLKENITSLESGQYAMRDLIHFLIASDLFLKK
ncbi:MAG: DUF1592 domain-containing protein [Planctomyces sp.]